MDNCAVSGNEDEYLSWAYDRVKCIFDEFKFPLQKFCTNDPKLQLKIDTEYGVSTPSVVKLLGMNWDRIDDTLYTDYGPYIIKYQCKN